jgi:hypothetical protein
MSRGTNADVYMYLHVDVVAVVVGRLDAGGSDGERVQAHDSDYVSVYD